MLIDNLKEKRKKEKKEREKIIDIYETTIGKSVKNIFTLDKFLTDCGYPRWGRDYINLFYSYIHDNVVMENVNVIFINDSDFNILGFNIEDYGFDYLYKTIGLIKDDSETYEIFSVVDQFFIENIPSIMKIGVLNVLYKEHFTYLCKLIESNPNITVIKHNNWIDYHSIFLPNNSIYAEPQQYY